MSNQLTNQELHKLLFKLGSEQLICNNISYEDIHCGPLEINCFSICFWINTKDKINQKGIYVKIPKIILYNKSSEKIFPLTENDITLANNEYNSLIRLKEKWPSDNLNVEFIEPVTFLKKYNALLTVRVYGKPFFKMVRDCDMKRLHKKNGHIINNIFSRVGLALKKFHQQNAVETKVDTAAIISKIDIYCKDLIRHKVSKTFLDNMLNRLNCLRNRQFDTQCVETLKGFDVRQLFVDKNNKVNILDPGKIKIDYKEMDLARFIATCRILYWGTLKLFLGKTPNNSYENTFLNSYYGKSRRNIEVLHLLIIKEQIKHWRLTHNVITIKRWPKFTKYFIKNFYVNTFYKKQIITSLDKINI